MKATIIALSLLASLAYAEEVVYDFFSQDRSDLTTTGTYTWGADAQSHSGALKLGYKDATKPTSHKADITSRTLTWQMDNYNQGYLKFNFDKITLATDQQMQLLFDVNFGDAALDDEGNKQAFKTSLVSLGSTNVGVGSNGGAGLTRMTGGAAEGYSNVINDPVAIMSSSFAGETVSFVTTYRYDSTQWVAEMKMAWGESSETYTVQLGDGPLTVDHLYVSLDGTNWAYNEQSGNSTSQISNLMLKVSAVPEPATASLSLLALAGLAARRKRR